MQRVTWMRTVGIMSAYVILWSLSPARTAAAWPPGAPMQQLQGRITAINTAANTVSVEVQKAPDHYTLSAPLSATAVIKKGGTLVPLSALRVGDQVRVQWEQTTTGHRIIHLEANQQGYPLKSPLEHPTHVLRSV